MNSGDTIGRNAENAGVKVDMYAGFAIRQAFQYFQVILREGSSANPKPGGLYRALYIQFDFGDETVVPNAHIPTVGPQYDVIIAIIGGADFEGSRLPRTRVVSDPGGISAAAAGVFGE